MEQMEIRINSFEEFRKLMRLLSLSKTTYKWRSDEKPEEYTPRCAKSCSKEYPMWIELDDCGGDIHYISYSSSPRLSGCIPFASFVNKLRLEVDAFPVECILPEIK